MTTTNAIQCESQMIDRDSRIGILIMANAAPPVRPPNAAPPVRPRPHVSAVAPGNTVPVAPLVVAFLPAASAETVAPTVPTEGTVAPVVQVAVKKRRGRKAGMLAPYHGTFVYDANGNAVVDMVDGKPEPQRQKLATMPPLTGEGCYSRKTHEPLKESNFEKSGDFYRHLAQLAELRMNAYLADAKLADEGKAKITTTAKLAKMQTQIGSLLANLQKTMPVEAFRAFLIANGVDPAEYGIAAAA